MVEIEGDSSRGMWMRYIWALADGDLDLAEDILKALEDQNGERSFWRRAMLLASQGQVDSARYLMEEHNIKNLYLYHLLGMKNELYNRLEELIDYQIAQGINGYQYYSNLFYLETYRDEPEFQRIISKSKKLNDSYLEKVQDIMVYVE